MNQLTAFLAAWTMVAAAFCDTAPGTQSIAPNMSFEQGEDDGPADWGFYSWKDASGWWDTEHAYRGEKSLGMGGLNGGWSTNVFFPSTGRSVSASGHGCCASIGSTALSPGGARFAGATDWRIRGQPARAVRA